MTQKDPYGFFFWLRWITTFAGSFVFSAVLWTLFFTRVFGPIRGEELMVSWTVSVFGTWFILVIPFMRKKERIWKRLNQDQERSVDAWFGGFGFFLAAFVLSCLYWDLVFREKISQDAPGFDPAWMKAVFSTWLLILIPLLVWMYRSADRIFKSAHERQTREPLFQTHWVEPEKRRLPENLARKLRSVKPTLPGGHLVSGRLKSGQVLPYLFVLDGREVVGAYDWQKSDFDANQLDDLEVNQDPQIPVFDESRWVRFNG